MKKKVYVRYIGKYQSHDIIEIPINDAKKLLKQGLVRKIKKRELLSAN